MLPHRSLKAAQDHSNAALNETIRSNFCNGVVYWEMIKSYLTHNSEFLQRSQHRGRRVDGESLDLTLEVLRCVR